MNTFSNEHKCSISFAAIFFLKLKFQTRTPLFLGHPVDSIHCHSFPQESAPRTYLFFPRVIFLTIVIQYFFSRIYVSCGKKAQNWFVVLCAQNLHFRVYFFTVPVVDKSSKYLTTFGLFCGVITSGNQIIYNVYIIYMLDMYEIYLI